jgi:hypothetical protein
MDRDRLPGQRAIQSSRVLFRSGLEGIQSRRILRRSVPDPEVRTVSAEDEGDNCLAGCSARLGPSLSVVRCRRGGGAPRLPLRSGRQALRLRCGNRPLDCPCRPQLSHRRPTLAARCELLPSRAGKGGTDEVLWVIKTGLEAPALSPSALPWRGSALLRCVPLQAATKPHRVWKTPAAAC